ncbi:MULTISPECIES: T7SS effector LXG polymorphic toxin [unclassified Parvimonas]|uniref:T7SS effector LXG polymorphic toxin n=1 Tax=unclassified Parvimonas TaxID=1151464 RepID=UPI002B471C1A|nr:MULTISPECIES: T7SS effector LXG polymorphic toxin [unclassified Parvimonas]MEB3025544.1 T7SS effector LXG polymorphic toxin [Parvimonas sp. M13]MEB3089703.1 T7SS effector LXG polymorphic toxin [Parvimonas sp. M20]
MEYKIHFEDIANVQRELSNSIAIWNNSINNLLKAIKNFSDDSSLKGETMDSIKVYLCEVHGTLLVSMQNLIQDYAYSYLLYKDGYYNIDSDSKAKLSEQTFVNLRNELSYSRSNFANQIDLLVATKNKVSDLISYSGNSHDTMISNYNFLISGLDTLNSRIVSYEKLHQSQDLKLFKELLVSTRNFMENYSNKARDISTYQSGDLAKIDFAKDLAVAFDNSNRYLSNRKNIIEEADKRDKVRWEQIFAKERRNKGIKNLIVGGLTLLVGTAAIVATGGSAIPLVAFAGKICGTGTVAYSVSNMTEAGQDVIYGSLGDNKTGAINPIRDTVFLGNDKLYHGLGQIFTTGSSILIPIGKTNSIVKGGFQFLAGSAGAWVGGKVGYYGLKQLGFSEENARIGQVLFSIYAGYKASQIAGKFTLNKTFKFDDEIIVEKYGILRKNKEISGQTHHLNQDAAFKGVIPSEEGLSIKLEGNILTDIDSPHYRAHEIMEKFWDKYRNVKCLNKQYPTIAEHNCALKESLLHAGLTKRQVKQIMLKVIEQQQEYGLTLDSFVPRIPGKIYLPK